MNVEQKNKLKNGASAFGIALDDEQIHAFTIYAQMLEAKNQVMNLTRVKPEDYVDLHFLDSLTAAKVQSFKPGMKVLDVGTGAGLPGIPLAIAFPGLDVALMDSTAKKLRFLDEVISSLKLKSVKTVHGRAEELQRSPLLSTKYDIVTARAVADLKTLAAYTVPFLNKNGVVIAYKSTEIDEELNTARGEIGGIRGVVVGDRRVKLPGTDIERRLILLSRIK